MSRRERIPGGCGDPDCPLCASRPRRQAIEDAFEEGKKAGRIAERTKQGEAPRASALNEARDLITGDRNAQYGPPTQDFKRTAEALTALGYRRLDVDGVTPIDLLPSDVAILVAMVKVSRLMHSRNKRDNWVDLAGYAGCGYECTTEEN